MIILSQYTALEVNKSVGDNREELVKFNMRKVMMIMILPRRQLSRGLQDEIGDFVRMQNMIQPK